MQSPQKPRTPAQFSFEAKEKLDHIKEVENLSSYNDVVDFLYGLWKSGQPSMAGAFAGMGPFDRTGEEEDSHRTPY
ncbi:MAG: hypothetical protein M0R30_03835 [Methanoregula sp.]|uniref:hypothetical protein n=1 Tax=Methanoregula sp. TaxID=2052170 RepID=UPI0025F0948A|nr:hypothetical protein [Methanoregula sp.]MCK9630751.1 hypothetical protein [Methanoregula sp.]